MNTSNENEKNREDIPRDINPRATGFEPSSKKIKAQEKIDIKESEVGRELGQEPYDEHIEQNLSQIDKETIELRKENSDNLNNEINVQDNRDHSDSTQDWDAENNRTGRHK